MAPHHHLLRVRGNIGKRHTQPLPRWPPRRHLHTSRLRKKITVPGHYAADGFAGETSAASGKIRRAHFGPPETGEWTYQTRFLKGSNIAVSDDPESAEPATLNGNTDGMVTGKFTIGKTDKSGCDNRTRHVGI